MKWTKAKMAECEQAATEAALGTAKRKAGFAFPAASGVPGKITWHPSVTSWAVHFKDKKAGA